MNQMAVKIENQALSKKLSQKSVSARNYYQKQNLNHQSSKFKKKASNTSTSLQQLAMKKYKSKTG